MAVVLIIDDSPTELHLFQNMLEKSRIRHPGRGQRRRRAEAAKTSRPDLHTYGRRHARHERFPGNAQAHQGPATGSIPVIMITTKDQETDKIWGMRQGAVEYLVKPIDEDELVAMINAVMAA